jgi:hypothetical protein
MQLRAIGQELLLVVDGIASAGRSQFSLDGTVAVWGNPDGTVTVFEPSEVRSQLANFDLAW